MKYEVFYNMYGIKNNTENKRKEITWLFFVLQK